MRLPSLNPSPCCYWLTGLSGAGKTTIAQAFAIELKQEGQAVYVLDGDELRRGLNRDLGFSREDRARNVMRIAEVASLMMDAGLHVVVAAIAPYRDDRERLRQSFASGHFFEVFVDTPLQTCIQRDPKGLYRQRTQNMTGVSAPYEVPLVPDIRLDTVSQTVNDCVAILRTHHSSLQSR
jgi:adenylylsulfate kinase